ncbi:MAG: hypothetical protein RLZZ292_3701 [Bacteroidota bacterium]|jgi:hypothetical protein
MSNIDYLNQRTTNINIRISPMLKMQLIDSGARQGLNLSDYIMHLLIVEMSGSNEPEEIDITEYEAYQTLCDELSEVTAAKQLLQKEKVIHKKQLQHYEELTKGFDSCVGQTIIVGEEQFKINAPLDVLKIIVKSFKMETLK